MNTSTKNEQLNSMDTMKQQISSSEDDTLTEKVALTPTQASNHQLTFEHGDFPWRDINIRSSDGSTAYFADVSRFTLNTPDIVLRTGGKEGPTAGVAHIGIARSIKCGLGSDELSMDWVEMKRGGMIGMKKYRFEYRGRTFTLRHVKGDIGTGMSKVLSGHYQVVDESSGAEVARYTGVSMPGRKKGTLSFADGVNEELEVLLVLGVAAWREKARRRRAGNAGGGGAGGV